MNKKMDRRKFILTGVAGVAGVSVIGCSGLVGSSSRNRVDKVKLGKTGLSVSRIAMGTGTHGYNKASDQTRLGMDNFIKLAHHAYEKGITMFDMADGYGSMPYVAGAVKELPREKITLLSKIWTSEDGSGQVIPVSETLDRFRKELNTDYVDIVLLHCMMAGNWTKTRKSYMDGLSKAKQDGIVKRVGVSCHNWDAMVEAVESPWVDVIMARINPFQSLMDGTPEAVGKLLGRAKENGKGVIGMKIFGEGSHVKDEEREQSFRFALSDGNIHSMTLGMVSTEQIDDAVARVMNIVATT